MYNKTPAKKICFEVAKGILRKKKEFKEFEKPPISIQLHHLSSFLSSGFFNGRAEVDLPTRGLNKFISL